MQVQQVVVALVFDREGRSRILEAVPGGLTVVFCDDPQSLSKTVDAEHAGVVLAELRDRRGASTLPAIRALRHGFPSVPVVAYCCHDPEETRDLLKAGAAGVSAIALRGRDDLGRVLARMLARAGAADARRWVARAVKRTLPPDVYAVLERCLGDDQRTLKAETLAASLGTSRRTLAHRLKRAGLPPLSDLLAWSRLLVTARLLADPHRTITTVAEEVGFASPAAFRSTLRRHSGLHPAELHARDSLLRVLRALHETIPPAARPVVTAPHADAQHIEEARDDPSDETRADNAPDHRSRARHHRAG
ncbi:MAG: helix-turn-helix domain-containing protein [Gemmatimonadaceae bacterium]